MKAEHPAALKYIFQDEIYLLPDEKSFKSTAVTQLVETPVAETAIKPVEEAGLVPPAAQSEAEPMVQAPVLSFYYLGTNKKAFLIFTHYPDLDFIANEHLTALQNILKRKGFELDDVAIFNTAKNAVNDWNEILNYFTPEKVLLLGKSAIPSGLDLPPLNQLKQMPDYTLLYSFSFDEMMTSTDNKKAFWDQMKNL
ncbi:hypothetical protein [Mucilaginibacter panaciglaebae]|uniref:Uncharacterized protein n=1 Tax=Mucilaginibacter panaciglaebae TaxID=502331 RepID=A0ABP7WZY5_9SPHI